MTPPFSALLPGCWPHFQPHLAAGPVRTLRRPRAEGLLSDCVLHARRQPQTFTIGLLRHFLGDFRPELSQPFAPSSMFDRQDGVAGTLIEGLCASALGHQQPASAFLLSCLLLWEAQSLNPAGHIPWEARALFGTSWALTGSVGVWLCHNFVISFLTLPNTSHCPKADHLS